MCIFFFCILKFFLDDHWIFIFTIGDIYKYLLEYADTTYTDMYNYSRIQASKQLPKTRTERVLYLEVYDTPAGLRDYPNAAEHQF